MKNHTSPAFQKIEWKHKSTNKHEVMRNDHKSIRKGFDISIITFSINLEIYLKIGRKP